MGLKHNSCGTTKLHLDVTDAINILVWSEGSDAPAATWHIFSADHAPIIRQFLSEELETKDRKDLIHRQSQYLSDAMLTRLRDRFGVSPWMIHQSVGDAIFIPAGCAHQVSEQLCQNPNAPLTYVKVRNLLNAIKVACDSVSPQNISHTLHLAAGFHLHSILSQSGDDLLQIHTMLWYAWLAIVVYQSRYDGM